MREALIRAIQDHPEIAKAAITGSHARRATDSLSDLDILLVARDLEEVRQVRAWLPGSVEVLICTFHRTHYCTVLLSDFQKLDLAIFSLQDPASSWVVHDYQVIKGGPDFETQLDDAAQATREKRASHLNPDVSIDNILLLLVTASHRVIRGELLSAHGFLAMACDMTMAFEARRGGVIPGADLLDPRRRLEQLNGVLAAAIHASLFTAPSEGISLLAQHFLSSYRTGLSDSQLTVLNRLQ